MKHMRFLSRCRIFSILCVVCLHPSFKQPARAAQDASTVNFTQSAATVDAYDFVEVTMQIKQPTAQNPFTDVGVTGQFNAIGAKPLAVDGFCDAADGSIFRIRFMPTTLGKHVYSVTYRHGDLTRTHSGTFQARDGKRRGIVRVDKDFPWHFVWEGTGEHYFMNGTTAFLLMGWQDEKVIFGNLDRIHRLKANRLRVPLDGCAGNSFWGEPIIPNREFHAYVNEFVARRPGDFTNPGFDYTRFDVAYWQKFERMLGHARDLDMIISVILGWADSKVHPPAGGADEQRYFRYAAARVAAFANITWDLGDDISLYRDLAWSHKMGSLLHGLDPYHHLATDHPVDNKHQDRTADWFGFTSFQEWSRPQHSWMLNQRTLQKKTGRIIPQTNEEYGYEDHYPKWAQNYPSGASADGMRRTAWEIYMAGCYQTTGETARRGTGYWPDTGGGWVNGRGDPSMTMLKDYAHVVDFFTSFDWWRMEPHDELVNNGAFCLAEPGKVYAVYQPKGGSVTVKLAPGRYRPTWFNARTGLTTALPPAEGPGWTSPKARDDSDWALLLRRE
jgi:hypothetical protein